MPHEIVSVEAHESSSAAGATTVNASGPRLPDPDMEPRRADPEAIERLIDEIGAQSFPASDPPAWGVVSARLEEAALASGQGKPSRGAP